MSPRNNTFNNLHCSKYGLVVPNQGPPNTKVAHVSCRFCIVFGKEEQVGRKRKLTNNVKYFDSFRTDNYESHLNGLHPKNWKKYQKLSSVAEQEAFFKSVETPFTNIIDSHFYRSISVIFNINKLIVEIVVGESLFHPDDVDGVSAQRALNIFEPQIDETDCNVSGYILTIKTWRRFSLCVKFISCGATFRMAVRLIQATVESIGLGYLRGMNENIASNYARMVCCISLQILSDILSSVWGFSIALDSSTHQGKGYLDTRVRFYLKGKLHNFHVLAIPLFERHTAENMFRVAV